MNTLSLQCQIINALLLDDAVVFFKGRTALLIFFYHTALFGNNMSAKDRLFLIYFYLISLFVSDNAKTNKQGDRLQ